MATGGGDGDSGNCSFVQNDDNNNIRDVFVKWNEAVQQHTCGKYSEALRTYTDMHELSARVLYNMAMAHIHLFDNSSAKKCLTAAVEKDELLAIAFYQRGLLHLKSKNYGDAIDDLESTRALLRGNTYINYRPLGLFGRLHIFQILFNLSLAYLYADDEDEAGTLLNEAIYDADHAQRRHISDTIRLIKENRVHKITPLLFTTEKVFAPPKSITCNLESPASWKGSTVVFSANREENFGTWDAMKTAKENEINSSLKSKRKKTFRKIKSLNDMKVSMVNSDLYSRRHSDSQMETIRENRHLFRNSSILDRRRSIRKHQLSREHSITLPEDSIIELDEPPDYEEIGFETTIQWHDDVVDAQDEHHPDALVYDCEIIPQPDGTKIRTSSSKATNRCNVKPPSNVTHGEPDGNVNDTDKITTHVYRKSFSAGMVEQTISESTETLTRVSKSTGDLEKNRRKSLLPLEEKKTHKTRNIFTQCFGRRQSNKRSIENTYPSVVMSGVKAMADMFSDPLVPELNTTSSTSGNASNKASSNNINQSEDNSSVNSDQRKRLGNVTENVNKRPAKTLGTVFGDKSSVVKYALTMACDNLTAVATPTIDREDLKGQNEKPRRVKHNTAVKEAGKIRSFKNKRAPPPPLATLGAKLAATQDMFAAFTQLNLDNGPGKVDTNNNSKGLGENGITHGIDRGAVCQEEWSDIGDGMVMSNETVQVEKIDNKLVIVGPPERSNTILHELDSREDRDVYNPKNKRAPPPPLAISGPMLGTTDDGMSDTYVRIHFDNGPENGDTNNNRKRLDANNIWDGSDRGVDCQEEWIDIGDGIAISYETAMHMSETDDQLVIVGQPGVMNSTYCELQPREDSDVYNPTPGSQLDQGEGGTFADVTMTTYADEPALSPSMLTETNKPDETVLYANAEFGGTSRSVSKKFRRRKSSTRSRVSVKVRKGSHRSKCFSFNRAKTPPPSYPPPVLKSDIRKRPTSTRRKSRKASGRKEGTTESKAESFTLGNATLAPLTMFSGAGSFSVKEQRPSLTSISQRGKGARKQSEEDLDDIELHVFEPAYNENTAPKQASLFNHGKSDTFQTGKDQQPGSTDTDGKPVASSETGKKADVRALLHAFIKSNTSIQHEFDNFVKQSYGGSPDGPDEGLYLCMDGTHHEKCTGECMYDQRGGN